MGIRVKVKTVEWRVREPLNVLILRYGHLLPDVGNKLIKHLLAESRRQQP